MKEHRIPRKIYKASMTGRRRKGRPRNRWKDEVEEDLRRMNVRGWREKAKEKKRMEGSGAAGQSSHRAVVPIKEEEDIW